MTVKMKESFHSFSLSDTIAEPHEPTHKRHLYKDLSFAFLGCFTFVICKA